MSGSRPNILTVINIGELQAHPFVHVLIFAIDDEAETEDKASIKVRSNAGIGLHIGSGSD